MTDIEISNKALKLDIREVAKKIGIADKIELYGSDKAKIKYNEIAGDEKAKLILVTSINPTPYGEGKTTVSIGLNDGLNKIGKNSIAVLREPSLGPVFGIKGGATGGGYSQVIPMEDINLHFTGDFHAITTANNLISAAIDNHIYFGNELNIKEVLFNRCMDMNDRALRSVDITNRGEKFNITAASEIMSILCLSNSFSNLKERLASILIAYDKDGKPIYSRDLKLEGSLAVILKDAIKPNLVQSLENNPVILHGGPFANIAHGCNSVIATKIGLKLSDYVVTEAGFGADLGAEKFLDIKCRSANLKPDAIVVVVTIKALKYNANVIKEDILKENIEAVKLGICNVEAHVSNMLKYTNNVMIALNRYDTDTLEEIDVVREFAKDKGLLFEVNNSYLEGGNGSIDLARSVVSLCENRSDFKLLYEDSLSIREKIETVVREIYHAENAIFSDEAIEKIKKYEELGYGSYPVCIAKTQYSLSDDPKKLGSPKGYDVTIRDVNIYTGAKFVVVYLGSIMTMPGLSKVPNYMNIDIDDNYVIKGLF